MASQAVVGDYSSADPYGSAELRLINVPSNCDLSLGEVSFAADTYCLGESMELYFDLTNNGTRTIDTVRVEVQDSSGQVLSSILLDNTLVPGETHEASTYFVVAAEATGQTVTVTVSPEGMEDGNPSNNSQSVEVRYEDICVEELSCGFQDNGQPVILANIVNRGYHAQSNLTVTLTRDSLDGDVVETKTISVLEPMNVYSVSFEKNIVSEAVYYVSVSGLSDSNTANNSDFVTTALQYTSFVEILDVTSDHANLLLSNELPGTCYAAIYDTNDKMLTAGSAAASANAGEVTITYKSIVLPDAYKIKVFLLDNDMAPLCKAYSQSMTR